MRSLRPIRAAVTTSLAGLAAIVVLVAGCTFDDVFATDGTRGGQPVGGRPGAVGTPQVLLSNLLDPPEVVARHDEWNVVPAKILYQSNITNRDHPYEWAERDRTRAWLKKHVPPTYDGYLALDWEGGIKEPLKNGPSDPNYQLAMSEMLALLRHCEQHAPNARVGYYGFPTRQVWGVRSGYREANEPLMPLLREQEVWFPSYYILYTREEVDEAKDIGRAVARLEQQLAMAGDTPVFLYIRDGFAGRTRHGEPVPADELERYLTALLEVEVEGRQAAGIVAWQSGRHAGAARNVRQYEIYHRAIRAAAD